MGNWWSRSDIDYVRHLAAAGVNGVAAVWNTPSRPSPVLGNSVWITTAVGGTVGALCALLGRRPKSGYQTATSSLLGSTIGFVGACAWASRGVAGNMARSVAHNVNGVRDARWLERHPIDYA